MSNKIDCRITEHQDRGDCLEALETIAQPHDALPQALETAVPCLFARLKHRIIRLRRQTHDDWSQFREEIEANLEYVLAHLNTRWLVSVADTYADYGTPVERRNAMCIGLLANWEKLALTQRLLAGDLVAGGQPQPDRLQTTLSEPEPLWDGMTAMLTTDGANVLPNLFQRLGGLMAETPVLYRMLAVILQRMKEYQESTVAALDRNHTRDLFEDIETALVHTNASPSATGPGETHSRGPENREFEQAVIGGLKGLAEGMSRLAGSQRDEHQRLQDQIGQLAEGVSQLTQELRDFVDGRFAHDAWVNEMRYRDLLALVERVSPLAPPLNIRLDAERPVAEASPDHKFPHGTAKDNTRAPWFVAKCEQLLGKSLSVLDLGCSGGGLILDFSLRGHKAVGLEGSDYSLKRKRAEWRTLGDRLFTCDVTGRFEVTDLDMGERMRFDLIMAWDVVEHLPENGLPQFLANVREHLKPDGLFVGTISTRASRQCPDGSYYHATVKPKEWWVEAFRQNGFELSERGPFAHEDFPRGNGISPLYPADFAAHPGTGFHFAARKLADAQWGDDFETPSTGVKDLTSQAQYAYESGNTKGAVTLLREALARDPDDPDALNDLGVVLGESGDPLEALRCFRRGLELEPDNANLRVNCAGLLRVLGESEAADLLTSPAQIKTSRGNSQVPHPKSDREPDRAGADRKKVYVHLENICGRARLEIEKVKNFLMANGCVLTPERQCAGRVLLFGCAFNEYTEQESKKRLDEFLADRHPEQEIFVIEGLADTLGKQLVRDGIVPADHVIRTGQYERLNEHFMRSVPYADIPEANFVGQYDEGSSEAASTCPSAAEGRFKKFSVQVGHGCNDSCSFCGDKVVVKNIRSKSPEDVIAEVERGVALGYGHIELIGDDVGAYGVDIGANIIELLNRVTALPGDFYITMMELNTKYLARHLDDFERLFQTGRFRSMAVAFQSGNDRILELMRRGYGREDVLRVAKTLRKHGVTKHAHVLVGFPTETREEFADSLSALQEGEFDSASLFIYQDRRTALASRLTPKVPEDEKLARLKEAEGYFCSLGYDIVRRADKLQIKRPAQGMRQPQPGSQEVVSGR